MPEAGLCDQVDEFVFNGALFAPFGKLISVVAVRAFAVRNGAVVFGDRFKYEGSSDQ